MLKNNQTKSKAVSKGERLDKEVASLFGRELVEQSKVVSIEAMAVEADLVAEGARQIREQSGNPERQRAIIRAMDEDTALALCKWIREPGCMARFIATAANLQNRPV